MTLRSHSARDQHFHGWRQLLGLASFAPLLLLAFSELASAQPDRAVELFYATNRAVNSVGAKGVQFGNQRGPLTFGRMRVSIPRSHKLFAVETPALGDSETKGRHVIIDTVEAMESGGFFKAMTVSLNALKSQTVGVFVHGYRGGFADNARPLAVMAWDLEIAMPLIDFSWPSTGHISGYSADGATVEWARRDFKSLVTDLCRLSSVDGIVLFAHSMGSRLVWSSVRDLAAEAPDCLRKVTAAVFAAPDIDAALFARERAATTLPGTMRLIVGVNDSDIALMASRMVNGVPRLGDATALNAESRAAEYIDFSGIKADYLRHSYYLSMFAHVMQGWSPHSVNRFKLTPAEINGVKVQKFARCPGEGRAAC